MRHLWIMVFVLNLVSVTSMQAEEVLIRLQTVVDGEMLNNQLIELECSEILVTTGESFRARMTTGDTTLTFYGKLTALPLGRYSLNGEEVRVVQKEGRPEQKTTTKVDAELTMDSPVLLRYGRNTSRWLGKRGRAHNSAFYTARSRIEVVLMSPENIEE